VLLKNLPLKTYQKHSRLFEPDLFKILDPVASIAAKQSLGSTSPREVERALGAWRRRLKICASKL